MAVVICLTCDDLLLPPPRLLPIIEFDRLTSFREHFLILIVAINSSPQDSYFDLSEQREILQGYKLERNFLNIPSYK